MCTVLLPPCDNPIAVNKYIIPYHITFFPMCFFISLLYMFRATQCSSSGESNCINTSSSIYIYIYISLCVGDCLVCRSGNSYFLTGIRGSHLHRVIYTRWCINIGCPTRYWTQHWRYCNEIGTRSRFVVWEMKRNVSVVCVCSVCL